MKLLADFYLQFLTLLKQLTKRTWNAEGKNQSWEFARLENLPGWSEFSCLLNWATFTARLLQLFSNWSTTILNHRGECCRIKICLCRMMRHYSLYFISKAILPLRSFWWRVSKDYLLSHYTRMNYIALWYDAKFLQSHKSTFKKIMKCFMVNNSL